MRTLRALALLLTLLWIDRAQAAAYVFTPGPEGEDSAPYAFTPFTIRGNNPTIYAFEGSGGEQPHSFEAYLRFELPPGLLLPGETVTEAYLLVAYAFDVIGYGDTTNVQGALRAHRVDGAWSEAGLTWVNRPLLGPALDEITGITQYAILEFDVTLAVRDWALGNSPNHGLALISPNKRLIGMYSFEADYGTGPGQIDPALRPTLVVVTGPGGPVDSDSDGYLDSVDNCRYTPNNQTDNGGVGTFTGNGIGNACECGDVTDDGSVQTLSDVVALRDALAAKPGLPAAQQKCSTRGAVIATDGPDLDSLRDDCQLDDIVVIRRALGGRGPGIGQLCDPATP